MNRIALILSLLFFSTGLFAQKMKKFTASREAYLKDLEDNLKETDIKKELMDGFLMEFRAVWEGGGITDKEAAQIYDISNNFLKKRVNGYEPWWNFLGSVMHFENNEKPELLLPWLEDLEKFSSQKPARFTEDYVRTMYQTFKDYVLFDDGRIKWKVATGDYEFGYDGEPVFTFDICDVWGYYKNDSTLIEGTKGLFYPKRYEFLGQGGNVYFVRAGLSEDSARVTLSNYKLNVTKTDFEADSVKLTTLVFKRTTIRAF